MAPVLDLSPSSEDDAALRVTATIASRPSASSFAYEEDAVGGITRQFMQVTALDAVDKTTALEIMNLHHAMVVHVQQLEYEKNKEIARLASELKQLRAEHEQTQSLAECKSTLTLLSETVEKVRHDVTQQRTDVESMRHTLTCLPPAKRR